MIVTKCKFIALVLYYYIPFTDPCTTTQNWLKPSSTFSCPDLCPARGVHFSGNIADPNQGGQYIACWNGMTVGCVACPSTLLFNEQENACLYEGRFMTARH